MKLVTITEVHHTAETPDQPQKAEKKAGKRIGYNYIIFKSLKKSTKNDVVKCIYIKGLFNFGFCVIKEGSFGDTKDKHGRDIIDRLKWQQQLHTDLAGKVRIPRCLDSFEENGNYYLALERIRGISLHKAIKDTNGQLRMALITGKKLAFKFLDYIVQMTDLLNTLHQLGVVHRDVTPANFIITPRGKVTLIDMELSYSLQLATPSPPFALGTAGYTSPEQQIVSLPTINEDVFALGAIILHLWCGISPLKLTDGSYEEINAKVRFLIADKQIANLVAQCLHPAPAMRPAMTNIKQIIIQYKRDLKVHEKRDIITSEHFAKEQIVPVLQAAIYTISSPLLTDNEGWFAANVNQPIDEEKQRINKARYASFNRGDSGILYLLACAKKVGLDINSTLPFVERGLERIDVKYMQRIDNAAPGLYYGTDGIAVSLAAAMSYGLIAQEPLYLNWANKLLNKEGSGYGISHGIAGQGIANLLCSDLIHLPALHERLTHYMHHLIEKQEKDGSWIRSVSGRRKRITRGFSAGIAGICYFLLIYGDRYGDAKALRAGEQGLQWLMKKAVHKKGVLQWLSSSNETIVPWLNDGSPGIALSFIKAYELTGKVVYKKYATEALYIHEPKVLNSNLSQHQGLSGLGEVYLEAYKVLQDRTWIDRADWIAQVIMHLKREHPQHGPYWLVEEERQPVANFMVGNSGVLHFLLRYCYPDQVGGPLMI